MVLMINNINIPNFVTKIDPNVHSLTSNEKEGMGDSRWD
jgi:hypothetical protein